MLDDELPLQCMYRWERERAERIFLTQPFGGGNVRNWTWKEAAGEVRRMAAYLKSQGWGPGARVAILSRNCAWWIMADLAIWMAGYATVPVYPSLKPQSVRQILEHSGAKGCFIGPTDEKETAGSGIPEGVLTIRFPHVPANGGMAWEKVLEATPPIRDNPTRPADDLATIIYTSGTTGAPKGVMHSFAAFRFDAKRLTELLGATDQGRALSYLPLAHIVERAGMEMPALLLGSRIFFTEGIETFLADLHRARPTIFLSVPRLLLKFQQGVFEKVPRKKLDKLLRLPIIDRYTKRRILRQLGLNTVVHAACGAAPLPTEILLWYRNLGLDLAEGYGMTETLITHLPKTGHVRPGYVGPALDGIEVKLGDNNELLVKSPMNMLGYYNNPQATRDAFTPDGFFRTGDVVQLDPDGQIKIIGRLKEQFKTSKGKYVVPAPIESRLMAHPDVEACCLMGAGHPNPFAIVLLSPEARRRCTSPAAWKSLEQSLQALLDQVNAQLDSHERVQFIAIADGPWTVGNGFMTPTLKIKRTVLENRYQSLVDNWERTNCPVVWESGPGPAGAPLAN
jgi:long-chain acyl-CoA synthetase